VVVAKQQTPYTQKATTETATKTPNANSITGDSPGVFNQLGKLWDKFVGLFAGSDASTNSSSSSLPAAK
jgi:hypothetical protein